MSNYKSFFLLFSGTAVLKMQMYGLRDGCVFRDIVNIENTTRYKII